MPAVKLACASDLDIFDIRQDTHQHDLRKEITDGLTIHPPTLPSFLLWDDKGLELFDQFSQSPSYNSFHSEIEILQQQASEIVDRVPARSGVIELGCGTIRKTKLILSALEQQQKCIQYFALDVSREGLTNSIIELTDAMTGSQFLTITGLLGTYEDCVSWLTRPESLNDLTSITFLWMGNSIANFSHYSQASTFLFRFKKACQQSNIRSQFILSTDICQDRARIYEAYNTKGIFGEFLLNVLTHANAVMDKNIFCMRDWSCEVEFNAGEHNLHVYVAPRSDLQICIGEGQTISLSKGERVQIATSGKWTEKVMQELCTDAGLVIHQKWKDQGGSYCVYCVGE